MKSRTNLLPGIVAVIIGGFLLPGFISPAIAEETIKEVVATGVAPVKGENISGARHTATQDALRQALEQGVGMLMDATTIVKNDDLMEKIYTNTQGYITGYKIIKERREQNGLYRVKIQAGVKTGELRNTLVKLGIIKAMMDYPRIMFLPYPGLADSPASDTAQTVLISNFTEKRFDVVDPAKSGELHNDVKAMLKVDTFENVAAKIGLKHHAEIVVLYGVHASVSEFDGIMENTPVTLRTKSIVTTTGQVLGAEENNITGIGKTADLSRQNGAGRAAEALAPKIITSIFSWWADYIANGLPYVVTLQTEPKADRLVIVFEQALEGVIGVVSLTERSSGGGITEMMVKYKGSSARFKREILTSLNRQQGFENLYTVASKGRFLVFSLK